MVAATFLAAGVPTIGDSRIENIEAMRRAGITAPVTLIRSPMLSQVKRVVASANASLNTELDIISALSNAAGAAGRRHAVILMVELGDLREGIMTADLDAFVRQTLRFPHIDLHGIGANLACFNGIAPDVNNMRELSRIADHLDRVFATVGSSISCVVSGGNSSNLEWAAKANDTGRINDLRLGESILLGMDPLHDTPIAGLFTDAITLYGAVIEAKTKPSQPWGEFARSPFARSASHDLHGDVSQMVLALGHQDVDPDGLVPPRDMQILGASSDHLVVETKKAMSKIGHEICFQLNYSALLRAMTSPFVGKVYQQRDNATREAPPSPDGSSRIAALSGAGWH